MSISSRIAYLRNDEADLLWILGLKDRVWQSKTTKGNAFTISTRKWLTRCVGLVLYYVLLTILFHIFKCLHFCVFNQNCSLQIYDNVVNVVFTYKFVLFMLFKKYIYFSVKGMNRLTLS